MDDKERHGALMTALTTEHFVLQTAASSTISEAAARSSLYMFSLSSSLIAIGFTAQAPDVLIPFVAVVLPALFLLGVLTVVRLVDTALENMQCLAGIAQIRNYYRTLTPEAATYFAASDGRWPEASSVPSLRLGPFVAFLSTSASMIALINSIVAGTGVALLINEMLGRHHMGAAALSCGVPSAVIVMVIFLAYERWRFSIINLATQPTDSAKN
jgi:hypothetical protein